MCVGVCGGVVVEVWRCVWGDEGVEVCGGVWVSDPPCGGHIFPDYPIPSISQVPHQKANMSRLWLSVC